MSQVVPSKPWTDLPTANRSTGPLLRVRCGVTCRASMHNSICLHRRVQPVKPLHNPWTLQRQRLGSRQHDCSRVLPLASYFEASSSELRHSGSGGGRKKKAYLFEVEWTGEQKQQSSGQAEQTMVNRYLALLRESDVLNKLKARRRFERPRDRDQRRFAERMQRIKWERQQDGFVPESLESAGGNMYDLSEPFFEYFDKRAEWDKVVDYNEKTPQQREADELGSYSLNRNGVVDLAGLMPEESVAGGYLTSAAGAAAAFEFGMQSGMADSYAAAASGGGYVQQQDGSDWLVPMNALVNHAANADTDVAFWQAQLAAEFQAQQQQQQDLYQPPAAELPYTETYNSPAEPTMLQQLQQSMDFAASAASAAIPATAAAGSSAAVNAAPGSAIQEPNSWLNEAPDFQVASTASHTTNPITDTQYQQQNTAVNGPLPPVQQQQQQPLYSSPQVTAPQQTKQQRFSSGFSSLPLDLAAFGWSDGPAIPGQSNASWLLPAQPVPAQQQVQQQQQQGVAAHLAVSRVDSAAGTVHGAAVSLGAASTGAALPASNTAATTEVAAAVDETSAATSSAVPMPAASMTELVDFSTLSNLGEMATAAAAVVPAAPVTPAAKTKPRKRSNKVPTAAAGAATEAEGPARAADQAAGPAAASSDVTGSKSPARRKPSMRTAKTQQGVSAAVPKQGASKSPDAPARPARKLSAAAPSAAAPAAAAADSGVAATQEAAVSMSDIQAGFAAGEGSVNRPHDMLALQDLLTDSLLLISDTTVTHGSNGSSPNGKHNSAISVKNGVDISSITVANGKPGSNGKRRGGIAGINKAGGSSSNSSSSSRQNRGAQKSPREQGTPVASR